jgi:hypothetical protein
LDLAKFWIGQCASSHGRCNVVPPSGLPTRLIDVGDGQGEHSPRIYIPDPTEPAVPYITLSHAWGTGNIFRLTSTNLEALKIRIPVFELSKTFRDAIDITRRLGHRYLWIDSLCIIQEPKDDWQREAPCMATVYGNALLNLVALGPSGQGCFTYRNPLARRPCRLLENGGNNILA